MPSPLDAGAALLAACADDRALDRNARALRSTRLGPGSKPGPGRTEAAADGGQATKPQPQPQGLDSEQQRRSAAAAALLAAQRASLYRGLSLGLLPALEALVRAIGRECLSQRLVRPGGGKTLPRLAMPGVFPEWAAVEHLLLAAPVHQAAGYLVSAAKLTRSLMTSAFSSRSKLVHQDFAAVTAEASASAVDYAMQLRVPLSVLCVMRAGCSSSSSSSSGGCGAAGGVHSGSAASSRRNSTSSASTSAAAAAAALPQQHQHEHLQQQHQQQRRVELVSLLVASWLPMSTTNWLEAAESDVFLTAPRSVDLAVGLAMCVLDWVPVLVTARQLALERGDTKAAEEWRSFILMDIQPVRSMAAAVTARRRQLAAVEGPRMARAAEALWAGLPADCAPLRNGNAEWDLVQQHLPLATRVRLERLRDQGEAGEAARAVVLAALRAGSSSSGGVEEGRGDREGAACAWREPVVAEDAALLLSPAEVRRRLGLCAHRGCRDLRGGSEACVRLTVACPGCGTLRYCSTECGARRPADMSCC